MRAEQIIAKKVNPEGYAIPKKLLAEMAVARVRSGLDQIFRIDGVVFTVGKEPKHPIVHIYSIDDGNGFLKACRKFMKRVWEETSHPILMAPIADPRVKKLAERFGWKVAGTAPTGHTIYLVERPQ